MHTIYLKKIAAVLATLSLAMTASAQYIWLDEKGTKQYSDMPPAASVPKERILKQPGSAANPPPVAAAPASAGTETKTGSKAPKTAAELNADFNKRRMEQAEKDKKSAEEAKIAADKSKNCERTRQHSRSLASGERLYRTDKNGEREYLDDDQRAKEMNENKAVLANC